MTYSSNRSDNLDSWMICLEDQSVYYDTRAIIITGVLIHVVEYYYDSFQEKTY
jgi:hypothetical protein